MGQPKPIVLLVTHSGDFDVIDRVARAVESRGADAVRIDTDRFPLETRWSARIDGARSVVTMDDGLRRVEFDSVRGVWVRQIWEPKQSERLDERHRAGAQRQSMTGVQHVLSAIRAQRWVNDPDTNRRASVKTLQLRVAAEVGMCTPPTLITNDPAQVRDFYDRTGGRVVTKLLAALSKSMGAPDVKMYTQRLEAADLDALDALRHAPMIFQELVEKERELRVVHVDGKVFAGSVRAPGMTDWRAASPRDVAWEADELPEEEAEKVRALMRRLGLVYGALDVIRTPEGEHVFLEVNPMGEWGMLEVFVGMPIADALAGALVGEGGGSS